MVCCLDHSRVNCVCINTDSVVSPSGEDTWWSSKANKSHPSTLSGNDNGSNMTVPLSLYVSLCVFRASTIILLARMCL